MYSFTFFDEMLWIKDSACFTLISKHEKLCLPLSCRYRQDILALEDVILEMVRLVSFSGTKPVKKFRRF